MPALRIFSRLASRPTVADERVPSSDRPDTFALTAGKGIDNHAFSQRAMGRASIELPANAGFGPRGCSHGTHALGAASAQPRGELGRRTSNRRQYEHRRNVSSPGFRGVWRTTRGRGRRRARARPAPRTGGRRRERSRAETRRPSRACARRLSSITTGSLPPTINSVGATTRGRTSAARSGRPPRETTASTREAALGRGDQRGGGAGARAEAADRQARQTAWERARPLILVTASRSRRSPARRAAVGRSAGARSEGLLAPRRA